MHWHTHDQSHSYYTLFALNSYVIISILFHFAFGRLLFWWCFVFLFLSFLPFHFAIFPNIDDGGGECGALTPRFEYIADTSSSSTQQYWHRQISHKKKYNVDWIGRKTAGYTYLKHTHTLTVTGNIHNFASIIYIYSGCLLFLRGCDWRWETNWCSSKQQ